MKPESVKSLTAMSLLLNNPDEFDLDADGDLIAHVGGKAFLIELKVFEVTDA